MTSSCAAQRLVRVVSAISSNDGERLLPVEAVGWSAPTNDNGWPSVGRATTKSSCRPLPRFRLETLDSISVVTQVVTALVVTVCRECPTPPPITRAAFDGRMPVGRLASSRLAVATWLLDGAYFLTYRRSAYCSSNSLRGS